MEYWNLEMTGVHLSSSVITGVKRSGGRSFIGKVP